MKRNGTLLLVSVAALAGILGGYIGTQVAAISLRQDISVIQVQKLQEALDVLVARDGTLKDPKRIIQTSRSLLAMQLTLSGQSFASIAETQWRDEVVRIARIVDRYPQLQNPANGWANETRACILTHFERPEEVEQCVRTAPHAIRAAKSDVKA